MPRTETIIVTDLTYDQLAAAVGANRIRTEEPDEDENHKLTLIVDRATIAERRAIEDARQALQSAPSGRETNTSESDQPRRSWTRRYVELADVANREGLNHGKIWRCSEIDIQAKGAHPSWEGDYICYVYE